MGNIQEEAAFCGKQSFDPISHTVEGAGQAADFVTPVGVNTHGEIAAAETLDSFLEIAYRAGEVPSQPVTQQNARDNNKYVLGKQEPGAHTDTGFEKEEPITPVLGRAAYQVAGTKKWIRNAMAGAPEQVGPVLVREQIASAFIGQNALRVIDVLEI